LQHALPFFISILMFASAVFYPISGISAGSRWIFHAQSLAPLMESHGAFC
jgi:ABC-type polysaccharide/polyol phosphate export permease